MSLPYLKYFTEWNPEAFKQARAKGLLDEPSKKAPNIPDYILEYIESSSPYNSEWQDVNFYVNNLNHIKKNKIDNGRYSIRIVIYKNNFYSITPSDYYSGNLPSYLFSFCFFFTR